MNNITTNIPGYNVVNSAGGIMIQETKSRYVATQERKIPLYQRSRSRSLKVDTTEILAPVHLYNRVGSNFPQDAVLIPPPMNNDVYSKCINEYHIWLVARVVGSSGKTQPVPGFGGFISDTGNKPSRKSIIDYFVPIDQPFTEYSVITELLRRSEEATMAVGQGYVLSTFDRGGCMKALPLIWKAPDKYKKHVVTPGHKCRGSGYSEILIEAELVTSGCLNSLLSRRKLRLTVQWLFLTFLTLAIAIPWIILHNILLPSVSLRSI